MAERGFMVEHTSVRTLIQTLLAGGSFAEHTHWGGGVQRSELSRSATRMFTAEWSTRGESPVDSLDARLSTRQADVAAAVLRYLEPLLVLIAQTTARLVILVGNECTGADRPVHLDQFSGRCCSAATTHVRRYGRPPDAAELHAMAHRVAVNAMNEVPRCPADEFVSRYAAVYDREWARSGKANLVTNPPSLLLLGTDRRPPLVRPGRPRETDMCGTDRSVYSRYAGYRPPAPGQRTPFRSRSGRCVQPETPRERGRDVADEEVRRACQPYGLAQGPHRSILRGVHHGLSWDGQGSLLPEEGDLSRRCVVLRSSDEQAVAQTVQRLVGLRMTRRSRTTLAAAGEIDVEGQHWGVDSEESLFAGLFDRAAEIVMRRLWKAVHGLEMYVEEHMCSCSLASTVAVAIDRAVPTALQQTRAGGNGPSAIPAREHTWSAGPVELAADLEAHNQTCDLLIRHPDVAVLLLTQKPGWRPVYEDLVADNPARFLQPDDFAQWCRDVVPASLPGRSGDEEPS